MMDQADAKRVQRSDGQLARDPNKGRRPELNLLTIEVTGYTDIGVPDSMLNRAIAPQNDPLVHDGAITLRTLERVTECRRRSHGEIEQADPARIEVKRQMKAQESVVQAHGCSFEEVDLTSDRDPFLGIGDHV